MADRPSDEWFRQAANEGFVGAGRSTARKAVTQSKAIRWARKRLGYDLRQNEHGEYLVCEDELDRLVRSPYRSVFIFLASALATATFTSILRWLGS
jgi:hypothetical protein